MNKIKIHKISGQAFTIMLVYVWARRNPMVRMNFFGLLTFQAPYLPWVLLGFSLLLGNSVSVDLLGMAVGHIYYFLEDVFPNQPGGKRLLQTPLILRVISIALLLLVTQMGHSLISIICSVPNYFIFIYF